MLKNNSAESFEELDMTSFAVFAGEKSRYLAQEVCNCLHCELGKIKIQHFKDGEFAVAFEESVRGKYVFLVQSTPAPSDNLMELLLMIDAAKRASAYKIAAVIPYFGWARQDRKDQPRVSIGAKLVADMLQVAGADRVITLDLHADQIQGFFNIPVDHLYGYSIFSDYIKSLNLKKLIIASPDEGGSKRAAKFAAHANHAPIVLCYKHREKANAVSQLRVLGNVKGKDVVLVDDLVDTAGTLCKAAQEMKRLGANSVRAVVSHGVMSGNASKLIEKSDLEEIVFSNSLPYDTAKCSKVKIISIAKVFASTIKSILTHHSISEDNIL